MKIKYKILPKKISPDCYHVWEIIYGSVLTYPMIIINTQHLFVCDENRIASDNDATLSMTVQLFFVKLIHVKSQFLASLERSKQPQIKQLLFHDRSGAYSSL